jgi:hypothetical protein
MALNGDIANREARVSQRAVRPPDLLVEGVTYAVMPIDSAEAVRRLLHLDFRDARTVLDLTFGAGRFWREPLPPGIALETNNPDPRCRADHRFDFRAVPLPDGSYDLVLLDPPHVADGGERSIMAARFGTCKGTEALRALIEQGCREAWRLARIGVLVKVADHEHEGRLLELSQRVRGALGAPSMVLHAVRPTNLEDPNWRAQRSPRCNYASYLTFRKDRARHRAW